MLHHSRNLLPVFYHLVIIMRSILCCGAYVHHLHHRPITTTLASRRAALSSRRRCSPISTTLLWSSSCSSSHSVQKTEQTHQHHSNTQSISHRSQGATHLDQVEDAINATLSYYYEHKQKLNLSPDDDNNIDVLNIKSPHHREMISISQHLQKRLQSLFNSKDCRRCWLQRKHCICNYCVSLEDNDDDDGGGEEGIMGGGGIPNVNRLFLLTHHKEICLTVDTAKLIMAAFPTTTRLVVSGIGREYQRNMDEMLNAVSNAAANSIIGNDRSNAGRKCLILFPTEDALTFDEIRKDISANKITTANNRLDDENVSAISYDNIGDERGWDVVVIDGTWSQARKMHAKYLQEYSGGCLYRVQLSNEAVKALDGGNSINLDGGSDDNNGISNSIGGHQLRRHPIKWREISTLEATRLLFNDMHTNGQFDKQSQAMTYYQKIGNDAALRQLGPPRVRQQ